MSAAQGGGPAPLPARLSLAQRGVTPGNVSPPWAGGESSDPHLSLVTVNLRKPPTGRLLPPFETLVLCLSLPRPPRLSRRSDRAARRGDAPLRSGRCLLSVLPYKGACGRAGGRRRRRKGRGAVTGAGELFPEGAAGSCRVPARTKRRNPRATCQLRRPPGPRLPASPLARVNTELRSIWAI